MSAAIPILDSTNFNPIASSAPFVVRCVLDGCSVGRFQPNSPPARLALGWRAEWIQCCAVQPIIHGLSLATTTSRDLVVVCLLHTRDAYCCCSDGDEISLLFVPIHFFKI